MKRMYLFYGVLVSVVCSLFTGCISFSFRCPYRIDEVTVTAGGENRSVKLQFFLFNDSFREIRSLQVVFRLYDTEGVLLSDDETAAVCLQAVAPGDRTLCTVPLEAFMDSALSAPASVEDLYVRQIRYTDGASWKDVFGMYAYQAVILP
ncbi:MAG: hypothetical protein K6G80_10950 [Treponema sp.]|nr:hypothetical protein [Treponema sp.]